MVCVFLFLVPIFENMCSGSPCFCFVCVVTLAAPLRKHAVIQEVMLDMKELVQGSSLPCQEAAPCKRMMSLFLVKLSKVVVPMRGAESRTRSVIAVTMRRWQELSSCPLSLLISRNRSPRTADWPSERARRTQKLREHFMYHHGMLVCSLVASVVFLNCKALGD